MNWRRMQARWNQVVGRVREDWGALTGSASAVDAGRRQRVCASIQLRYRVAMDEADRLLAACQSRSSDPRLRRLSRRARTEETQ